MSKRRSIALKRAGARVSPMPNVTDIVARLPTELLAMVVEQTFGLCNDDLSRSKTRAYLSATCSRWRHVALASRVLWSSIYLNTTFVARWLYIIDTNLERSGTCSLTLTIVEKRIPWRTPFPDIRARLVSIFPRTRTFRATCLYDTLSALKSCLSMPAPELKEFIITAPITTPATQMSFFPTTPKLHVLRWTGVRFHFPGPLSTLACVGLKMRDMDELVGLMKRAPNIERAYLHIDAALPPRHLEIPSLLDLRLTCPDAASALNLHFPALKAASLKFTLPRISDLRSLTAFAQRNGAHLLELSLSFAGDFAELATVLAHCRELAVLKLGEIGWSTNFVASFLRDLAAADDRGDWVCTRLEEIELRAVQLESAVRTGLIKIAEARCAAAPEGERPVGPLRRSRVVQSDQGVEMARRTSYAALNKKLAEILVHQST